MPDFITMDVSKLRASMRRTLAGLKRPSVVYGRSARHMRNYVRQTITMQGRKRPYVPLGHWAKMRTGRRKALITLRPNIRARHDNSKGEVFFQQREPGWHIDQHHTGFTSPAVTGKRMVVPAKGGGILAVFLSRKSSKIPAREVWPTKAEVEKEIKPLFETWVDGVARKQWHN